MMQKKFTRGVNKKFNFLITKSAYLRTTSIFCNKQVFTRIVKTAVNKKSFAVHEWVQLEKKVFIAVNINFGSVLMCLRHKHYDECNEGLIWMMHFSSQVDKLSKSETTEFISLLYLSILFYSSIHPLARSFSLQQNDFISTSIPAYHAQISFFSSLPMLVSFLHVTTLWSKKICFSNPSIKTRNLRRNVKYDSAQERSGN